jgi:acetylornithine/N-succinyldiaminopimelate aminotransferase
MFAYQNYSIYPDILVLAKSLGGGLPLGAIVTNDEISSVFTPGSHGSTFGGNAASCAAGCAVIDYIIDNNLENKAKALGGYFEKELKKLEKKFKIIKDIRVLGLMIGVEFEKPVAAELVSRALKENLVINRVSDYILRFLPPLVIKKADINKLVRWLNKNLKSF